MTVRSVEFVSSMLDDFQPESGSDPTALALFTLHRNELCSCEIRYDVSLPMIDHERLSGATRYRTETDH